MDGVGAAEIRHLFHPPNQVLVRCGWRGVRERLACNRGLLHALIPSPAKDLLVFGGAVVSYLTANSIKITAVGGSIGRREPRRTTRFACGCLADRGCIWYQ